MSTDAIKNFQQLGAVLALQIELEQRNEDIRELREDVAKLKAEIELMKRTWLPPVRQGERLRAL